MGEIRLTCPECGTEYRLPEGSIPPEGRNVECSSCGTVWLQRRTPAQSVVAPVVAPTVTPPAVPATPQLNRPLPASVLSVLQEEAELARQQREDATPAPAPRTPTPAPIAASEDWPATTVTDAASVGASATLPLPSAKAQAGPSPSRHINPQPNRPAQAAPSQQALEDTVNRTTPHHPAPAPPQAVAAEPSATLAEVPPADTAGYRRGLGWSVGIAAIGLLLYVAAPQFADTGPAGARMMEWRMAVDDGRGWLQDQLFGRPDAGD